ncbi:hypothetical protein ACQ4PT_017360 [Festuca glaucescens]
MDTDTYGCLIFYSNQGNDKIALSLRILVELSTVVIRRAATGIGSNRHACDTCASTWSLDRTHAARVLPVKTHVPEFEWKIENFSSLLETGAESATSGPFHCSGYNWHLQVSPMHKKPGAKTVYVALCVYMQRHTSLEQGHSVHAVFELSIYNHSNGMYCGCKASHTFEFKNFTSNKHCLIPLQELLKSSAFLVDDSCVFGLEILKIDAFSPEKRAVVVQKKATTVENLFVQKKGYLEGTYTWTMNNFLELDHEQSFARSSTFEVGGHKWYIVMYPCGGKCSTDCVSLYLYMDASKELPLKSGMVVQATLSILDQNNGKYFTGTTGLRVFSGPYGWGWPYFVGLKELKDPSRGYLVGSKCVIKADLTIVGSSADGKI